MRVNSITSYTQGAFEPKSTSQNQNQNGHAVNFGTLTKPIDVFRKELLAMQGVKEAIKAISEAFNFHKTVWQDSNCTKNLLKRKIVSFFKNFDKELKFLEEEKELLVDIQNGVVKLKVTGDSRFAEEARWRKYSDNKLWKLDYENITRYDSSEDHLGFDEVVERLHRIRCVLDNPKPPKPPEMVYKVESFADLNALAADLHY